MIENWYLLSKIFTEEVDLNSPEDEIRMDEFWIRHVDCCQCQSEGDSVPSDNDKAQQTRPGLKGNFKGENITSNNNQALEIQGKSKKVIFQYKEVTYQGENKTSDTSSVKSWKQQIADQFKKTWFSRFYV